MKNNKVILVKVCENFDLVSDGTTTYIYIDVSLPELEDLGPWLESMTAHTDTKNRSPNHRWKIVFWKSADGRLWQGPYDLFTAVAANGYDPQLPYTTTQNFGIRIKLALAVSNSSGSALERATVSAWIAAQMRT